MTTFVEARYGLKFGFVAGDNGWGSTFNLAAKTLGAMLNCILLSETLIDPPTSPVDGDCYYVVSGASGAWAGHSGSLAAWQGGAWSFLPAPKGLRAYIISRTAFYWYNGSAWLPENASSSNLVSSVNGNTGTVVLAAADVGAVSPSGLTTALTAFANGAFSTGGVGDIIVHDANGWIRLSHGTEGQILATHGTTSAPTWIDPPAGTGGGSSAGVTPGSTIAPAIIHAPDDYSTSGSGGSNLEVTPGGGTHTGGVLYLLGGSSGQIPGAVVIEHGNGDPAYRPALIAIGDNNLLPGLQFGTADAPSGQSSESILIKTGTSYHQGTPGTIIIQAGDQVENGADYGGAPGGAIHLKTGTAGFMNGHGGDLTITLGLKNSNSTGGRNGLIIVENLLTTDPGVTNGLWSNAGSLSLSGAAPPLVTVVKTTVSGATSLDFGTRRECAYAVSLTANSAITINNGIVNTDQRMTIDLLQSGSGGFTPSFPNVAWRDGTAPTFNTVAGKVDTVELRAVQNDIIGWVLSLGRTQVGPPLYRYWRINCTNTSYGSPPGQYACLAEVTMSSSHGGANLISTIGGTASASDIHSDSQDASKAVDGDINTYWNSLNALPAWWQWDFGASTPQSVVEISIRARNDTGAALQTMPTKFDLQCSSDGTNFTTLKTFTASWTTASQVQTFDL